MDVTITINATEAYLMLGQRRYWLRRLGWWQVNVMPVILGPMLFVVLVSCFPFRLTERPWLTLLLLVVCCAIPVGFRLGLQMWTTRAIRRAIAKWGEYQATIRLTDASVYDRSPYAEHDYPWDKFEQVWRFDDVWLLFLSPRLFYLLPADQITPEVGEFIVGKVRENGGKVK